jgi:hypothetical protein
VYVDGIAIQQFVIAGLAAELDVIARKDRLLNLGWTGETPAQQAFDQYVSRGNYGVDPFSLNYDLFGFGNGGVNDPSDGFWQSLRKARQGSKHP